MVRRFGKMVSLPTLPTTSSDETGMYPKPGFQVLEVPWRDGFKTCSIWNKAFLHFLLHF